MDTIDDLYGEPLETFTERRNQLGRELKKQGERDAAAVVLQLKKPSVPLWAVNRLARTAPAVMAALVEAAATMRAAQESALSGGGGTSFREASAALQRALDGAVRGAAAELREGGHAPSEDALRRAREILLAAALDEPATAMLVVGALREEPGPPGFGTFAFPDPRAAAAVSEVSAPAALKPTAARGKSRAKTVAPAVEPRAAAIAAAAREAETRADEARARATTDREAANRAAARATKLADRADDLHREARAARAAAEDAEREARAADRTARRSESEADGAERAAGRHR